jgi:hypothetical protein
MLRMTPLSLARFTDFNTTAAKPRPAASREGGNFGEKDERRVNSETWSYAGLTRVSINLQNAFEDHGLPAQARQ